MFFLLNSDNPNYSDSPSQKNHPYELMEVQERRKKKIADTNDGRILLHCIELEQLFITASIAILRPFEIKTKVEKQMRFSSSMR